MELLVLHQTSDFVVCVKPQGVESEHQMPALLIEQLGCEAVYPVHRLDKETGGVMVYATSKQGAAELSRGVQEGTVQKTYLAVVSGTPQPEKGRWDDLLFRDRQKNKSYIVKRERKGVKTASLSYHVLADGIWQEQAVSLVQVTLHTGRTHQIRVQFSGRNYPLMGDRRYGGMACDTLALWSARLSFLYKGGEQSFAAEPPQTAIWCHFQNNKFK